MSEALQAELKTLQDYVKVTTDFIRSAEADSDKHEKRIAEIEAQITEDAKPEVRHGQVVNTNYDIPCIVIGNGKNAKLHDGNGNSPTSFTPGKSSYGVICEDIFKEIDDLKAMQEDVTEFEMREEDRSTDPFTMEVKQISIDMGRTTQIEITGGDDCYAAYNLSLKELSEFSLKIRQLEATLKRQAE
jgi:septal ring factor EnvC (AmiA/AmiB activator)